MHSDRPYKENISFSRLTRCQIPYHHKSNSYRISQAVDRLETLKNDYFARLDNVELELKNKLIDHTSDPEMEVVIESQILVERLEEEVQAINYYLQTVDEMAWK